MSTHPPEYGEAPCWCGADACIGPKNLLAGFHCARRAEDAKMIATLVAALRGMASIYDGLDDALVHQRVMDKVSAARAALAMVESK